VYQGPVTTVSRLRTAEQLATGAVVQVVLLAALGAGAGLGPVGLIAGAGYAVGLCALLAAAARRAGAAALGPADLVTLARAVLVGGVTALVADGLAGGGTPVAVLVVLASTALVLDAVDGRVARRTGTASELGARFDMETDAVGVLVLSVHVATLLGPWVLAIGAMRYAFVAAGRALPWLRAPLPTSHAAKAVAAVQGVVLVVAGADVVPRPAAVALVVTALVLLAWSFGRSVAWLWRHRVGGNGGGGNRHPVASGVVSALAGAGVFVALVAPAEVGRLVPAAFLRVPVEALLAIALFLVLPARAGRVVATLAGVALGLLTLLKVLDLAFSATLARPFDPVLDLVLLGAAVEFLAGSSGRAGALGAAVAAVVLAVAVTVLLALSVRRLARLATRRRTAATRAATVLAAVWVTCAVLGAQIVPGVPVAAASAAAQVHDRAVQVRAGVADRRAFAAEAAVDPYRDTPGTELLTALRGKDVVVAFVESYGRDAVADPELAPALDDGTRRLATAGFAARSGFLTSPVAGGGSWMAHATFLSGLWVDNQQRYRTLVGSDRLTLTGAFARADWRTVGVMPGTTRAWPEGGFYGYDRVYDAHDLAYRGPKLGWAPMPDQYTLSAFRRLEHGRADRPPLMAEIALVSSHAPWAPVPGLVGWAEVGDGAVFEAWAGPDVTAEVMGDPGRARAEYRRSIGYAVNSIVSFVQTYGDDDLVLILLGDHQPGPVVTGGDAGRDVPITIATRDPAVLDRIAGWGWQDGLRPGPQAPVWRMDAFRDRFLAAFGR